MKARIIRMLGLAMLLAACHVDIHHSELDEKIANGNSSASTDSTQVSPNLLDGVSYEPSQYAEGDTFQVHQRKSDQEKAKCKDCHQASGEIRKGAENRHSEVTLEHASGHAMDCQTCHSSDEVWQLSTLNGKSVDTNHPYLVCQQCHFEQVKDWSGGAHGKRIGGWHGTVVRSNCTDCHNPHKPGFDSRWPSINPNHSKWKR